MDINNIDHYLENTEVDTENKTALKSILKELFFIDGQIYTFYPILFNYLYNCERSNTYSGKLGKFLYNVLVDDDHEVITLKFKDCFEKEPQNVLEKLMISGLPKLPDKQDKKEIQFYNALPFIKNLFIEDLVFMLKDPKFFIEGFEMLLKYYYFYYVSQLSLKLQKMWYVNVTCEEKLYFNLDWENSISKSRTSYLKGWKLLESNSKTLFAHAHTLEILNINNVEKPCVYWDIEKQLKNMSDDDQEEYRNNIFEATNIYKENINDTQWEELIVNTVHKGEVQQQIFKLFKSIEFQFIKSKNSRKKAYDQYCKWFEEFCKSNFLKRRGSLGFTLNITQDYLIFLTKLCIKNQEKIKLKDLFEAYKKRGVYFDRDSQTVIIQLFEKLNLIEKKSDSGDAQYVKSIL